MESAAVIRKAIGQTHYAVKCDACNGACYVNGQACGKCAGAGSILIEERRRAERRSFLRRLFDRKGGG